MTTTAASSAPSPRNPLEVAERQRLAAYLAAHFGWDWAGLWDRHDDLPDLLDEIGGWTSVYNEVRNAAGQVAADANYVPGMTGDWYSVSDRLRAHLANVASARGGWERLIGLRRWRGYKSVLAESAEHPIQHFPVPMAERTIGSTLRAVKAPYRCDSATRTYHVPRHNAVLYVRRCDKEGHGCNGGPRRQPLADLRAHGYLAQGQRVMALWRCALDGARAWSRDDLAVIVGSWLRSEEAWEDVSGRAR